MADDDQGWTVETIPNPTPEQKAFMKLADAAFREAEGAPPPSRNLMEKMRSQALTNDALDRPGPARDAFDHVMGLSDDEFEAEFGEVLYRNAYDEEDAEEAAMGPWTPPPPERIARRTREVYEAMAERDARRAREREDGDDGAGSP